MARLGFSGYESKDHTGSGPDGLGSAAAVSSETTIVRSGAASAKIDSGVGNAAATVNTGAVSQTVSSGTVTYWVRGCFYFANFPASATILILRGATNVAGTVQNIGVGIDSSGLLYLQNSSSATSNAGTLSCSLNTWNRIECQITVTITAGVSADATVDSARLNGVDIGAAALSNLTSTATPSVVVAASAGWHSAPGASSVVYVDDMAWNDSTGASQNSWPGDGKVVMLKPVSDNTVGSGWTDSAAATTGLWQSVDNTPPTGIADTTASAGHQIRNATSATANYDANLAAYSTAVASGGGGMATGDTVNCVQPLTNTGAPVVTAAKTGSVGTVSNPAITNTAFTAGGTAAANFWSGVTAGTYPTGWKWERGTMTHAPSVTLATSPVMRVSITGGTSTRIAMVDAMFLHVDYTPASTVTVTPPKPKVIMQAINRAASW